MSTDKVPVARSASTTAYAATMAEFASYTSGAYVPNYFTGTPSMDGTGAPGTAASVVRGDHVHPSDTTRAAVTAVPGASYCDNGGFAINQRVYVSGTALAAAAFGHDRWKAGAGGCTYTFAASSGPSRSITITAGSLQQVVEGASIAGGNYMLSWTGTAQGRVGAGSYAASPVAVTGIVAGANTTIEFNAGTLSQVKFEAGTVATPWVALLAQQDLANCQRFYQVGYINITAYQGAGNGFAATAYFPTTMRAATPTIAIIGSPSLINLPSVSTLSSGPTYAAFQGIATALGATGFGLNYSASADL